MWRIIKRWIGQSEIARLLSEIGSPSEAIPDFLGALAILGLVVVILCLFAMFGG